MILLPLDDRPCNRQMPAQLARLAGLRLTLPPRQLLGCFTAPGNTAALAEWLLAAPLGQTALLSIDMLCYGGLIASRRPDIYLKSARQRLEVLREIKRRHLRRPLYAFNVIMRLSITADSPKTLKLWREIALFSQLSDRVERLGESHWKKELSAIKRRIPAPILEDYLKTRARNHAINREVVQLVAEGILDYALFCQEDAAPAGPHIPEQKELLSLAAELGVADKVHLVCGADEAALTLLARALGELNQWQPKVAVFYGSREGAGRTALYEDRPIEDNIKAQLLAAGATREQSLKSADFALLVHTPVGPQQEMGSIQAESSHRTAPQAEKLAQQAAELIAGKIPVAIADLAYCNGADPELIAALGEEKVLPLLIGYAGWNTAGNSIGGALAQGVLWRLLDSPSAKGRQVNFLFARLVDDFLYQSLIRQETNSFAATLGASPLALGTAKPAVAAFVRQRLKTLARDFFARHFAGRKTRDILIKELQTMSVRLPWPRTFEVEINTQIAADDT